MNANPSSSGAAFLSSENVPRLRDRDAIHWVSLFDLLSFFRGRAAVRKLPIGGGGNLKQWFVKRFLTVNVAVTKPPAHG